MKRSLHQPGLFDAEPTPERAAAVAQARARMREMIDQASAAVVPPWKEEMDPFYFGGEFSRPTRLVPAEEREALLAEFNPHYERLYAIWAAMEPAPEPEPAPSPNGRKARQVSP